MSIRHLIGLIGFPLEHSFSNRYFTDKFASEGITGFEHKNFELSDLNDLPILLKQHPNLIGFNVTIPYKQQIIKFLNALDPVAEQIGAVNTVALIRDKHHVHLKGFNTDILGFKNSLDGWLDAAIRSALVFGSGGSSRAVLGALNLMNIDATVVGRNAAKGILPYEALNREMLTNNKLWINCTPVGMFPKVAEKLNIDYNSLTASHYMYDLVYNPPLTAFLEEGMLHDAHIKNGYDMLIRQAEASWEIWSSQLVTE